MNKFTRNRAARKQGVPRAPNLQVPETPQPPNASSSATPIFKAPTVSSGWDPFYRSKRWQRLRSRAFAEYGNKCVMCGRTPALDAVILHVDHIKPRSLHPELALDLTNLQILCDDCNLGKGNADDTDWRSKDHQARAAAVADARAKAKAERIAARFTRSVREGNALSKKEQRRLVREEYLRLYEGKEQAYHAEQAKPENVARREGQEKRDTKWLLVKLWFWWIAGVAGVAYAVMVGGRH